jgi:hypothetical protein
MRPHIPIDEPRKSFCDSRKLLVDGIIRTIPKNIAPAGIGQSVLIMK